MKKLVLPLLFLCLFLTGCGGDPTPPPVFDFNGMEITVGQTPLGQLFDAGFVRRESPAGYQEETMPASSWTYLLYYLQRDGQAYAGVALKNPSTQEQPVADCIIHHIVYTLYIPDSELEYADIPINGINYRGYTMDEVKATMEGYKIDEETAEFIRFTKGSYTYEFEFGQEEGAVSKIRASADFKRSYA